MRPVVRTLHGWAAKALARGVIGVALVVIAGLIAGFSPAPAAVAAVAARRSPARVAPPHVKLTPVPFHRARNLDHTGRKFTATATRLPAAGTGSASLAMPRGGSRDGTRAVVAGTPAWAQAVAPAHGAYHGPSAIGLRVEPQAVSQRLGIRGVVWQVSGLAAGAGGVRAGLSYAAFAQAYGGNFGQRLTLVKLPACSLTAPQLARCRAQTPLTSANDPTASTVSTVLALPRQMAASSAGTGAAGAAAPSVVLAATTTAGGEGGTAGTYGATPLMPSGSWSAGGSTGAFSYSYPVTLPGASSALTPKVELSYDSGSVDGQTSATQAQGGWAGDGWSTGDSYIEQSFVPCSDNPEGVTLPAADQTEDMCYAGKVLTLSLDGSTNSLVYDSSSSTWRLQDDNGATVQLVTGQDKGTTPSNAGYWVITERDGTSYYFGLNELPGWATGDRVTNSVDYEPVYSANSGDPCYNADFTQAVCTTAYRWHLDYVSDAHGDAMSYYYHQDPNYYGEDNGASVVKYIRDSHLTEIDYGFRDGSAYSPTAIPDEVVYDGTGLRCFASSCPAISSSNSGTAASDYPDVPYDLNCAQGSTCSTFGPTFWSTARLLTITTEQYNGSAFTPVDVYALGESEPATGDGTSPTLWLGSISRTAQDTGAGAPATPVTLPSVTFGGLDLPDRVDNTSFPALERYRLDQVTTETGAVTSVTYGTPYTCTAAYVQGMTTSASAAGNTESCYPVWWTPNGYTAPVMDWFEKYAVTGVTTTDQTGGAEDQVSQYQYAGGAAWHWDDNEIVKKKYRTYGQFRGYGTVTTLTGNGSATEPQTKSVTAYYRGMSDDDNTTAVTLTDSQGGHHDDANQLAGSPLEATAYTGANGTVDHSTITSYWISPATATRARTSDGLPDLTANTVRPAETWTRQALTDGGTTTWRNGEADTTYDATVSDANFGLPIYAYTHTVPALTAFDRCTTTTYAVANTAENLVGLVASTETDSVKCSGFTEGTITSVPSGLNTLGAPAPSALTRPDQVVSATQTFYDDQTSFSTTFPQPNAPTKGNVTMTRSAVGYSASGAAAWPSWQTTARDTYDPYGRVLDAYDGNGNKTSTAYTVSAAGLTTAVQVTNPLGQVTSTTLDPARGLTLTTTDANNVVTTEQYDTLGRLTSVWLDNRVPGTVNANYTYAYTVSSSGVSGVVAKTMGDQGGYATTVTVLDSLGRTRQTQSDTPVPGRLMTEDFYDSHGWLRKKTSHFYDSSSSPVLPAKITSPADGSVPDQDKYTFDGLSRVVQDASYDVGNVVSTTTTVYNGDRVTVIPPPGGVIKSTVTDQLGRTIEVDEYPATASAPVLHTPADTFAGTWYLTGGTPAATTYGYDQHGNQSTVTDAGSHTWTSTYNLLGQVTQQGDPDTGSTTAMTYDGAGNLLQQVNADGAAAGTVSFTYDALNRKTAEFTAATGSQVTFASSPSTSNQIASWAYDNSDSGVPGMPNAAGHLTDEYTYSGGQAYRIQAAGFNVFGEPTGETYTIPATSADAGLNGSYGFTHFWTTNKGLPLGQKYPAISAAGLPLETTSLGYLANPLDLVSSEGGTVAGYAAKTTYDAYGDVLDEEIGSGTTNLTDINSTYDPHTLWLTDQLVQRHATTPANVDEETYNHDLAGNVTSQVSNLRPVSATTTETQCFQYNGLDQLTQAWTANDACATAPTSAAHSQVTDGIGAASAYWTSWSFDTTTGNTTSDILGELTSQVQHSLASAQDVTTANAFGGASGGPHALTGAATTGGATANSSFHYDAAGNMTTRTTPAGGTQTLAWNAAGQLTQASGGTGGTTSYVYAPDGSLLLQANPGSTTLYLDGEQLTATTSGATTTVTGARIIPLPSGGDVVRTGSGTSYSFEIPDPHGTSDLYLDSTAQAPTWRQFTPYGTPRGTTTTWIDNRGFLNKPADPATGLTYVGARAYDPATSQFISPDPVLDPADPQNLNAYLYGKGNPVGNSDPTGLYVPVDPTSTVDPVDQFKDANPVHRGGASDSGGPGTANTSHNGGKTHGPGSPGGDCPWLPGLSAALCAHSNPIHTPQYLSLFTAVKKPAQVTDICAAAMQMFLGLITTCGPSLAATSGDDETGDTGATSSGGDGLPGDPLGPLAKIFKRIKDVLGHETGQVTYGSTDLSLDALVARVLDGNRKNTYAAARYIDGNGDIQTLVEHSDKAGHVEKNMLDRLREMGVDPSTDVTDLYVEFQPCDSCGRNYIPKYGKANITWSWPWSSDPAVQVESQKARAATIRDFWP